MSLAPEIYPIGCSASRKSFESSLCIGVATIPGATVFTHRYGLGYASTDASLSDTSNSPGLLMFREFATTFYSRSRKALTRPAPMPCDPPVTITVFPAVAISKPFYSPNDYCPKPVSEVVQEGRQTSHGKDDAKFCFPTYHASIGFCGFHERVLFNHRADSSHLREA